MERVRNITIYTLAMYLFVAIFSTGCAMFIPDYQQNRFIDKSPAPHVEVRTIPDFNACADQSVNEKKYYNASVLVNLIASEPAIIRITLQSGDWVESPPGDDMRLDFKAGIGHHFALIEVPGYDPMRVVFRIDDCE